jgi:2,4-dienoyl-CoA reductase-like NADH-dependent reductase (Old Yellow Enzyme family)
MMEQPQATSSALLTAGVIGHHNSSEVTMSDPRYPHVFRPLRLGPVDVRNRIFVPAHTTNYGEDNLPSERHLAYHQARARGGAGLIIFEAIRVHRSSLGRRQGVNGYDRQAIPAFARIARAVQGEGAKLFGQVIHLGRHIDGNFTRTPAWSASPTPWSATAPPPHPMTVEEIAEVVQAHAQVAGHLVEAGLDGVEVTLGHGHLLQQFLSPAVNRRTDAYGGSEANRARMALETLLAVRAAVGARVAMGIRISADEFLQGGLTLADMQRMTAMLCDSVAIDFINVSHSAYHGSATISTQMADMSFDRQAFHHLPRGIAQHLRASGHETPVFAVCRFRSVAEAEAMLAEGDIAMVGMARAHIADPALVRKAAEGREAETRPCVACNQGCAGFLALSLPITCLTNPATGREAEWSPSPEPTTAPKRVLVIGGGPAGMEAAGVAAARGHAVTLWEASGQLGGAMLGNAEMTRRQDLLLLIEAQKAALVRAGVDVRLNSEATMQTLEAVDADVILLATGATPAATPLAQGEALTMEQALAAGAALGVHVVVEDRLGSWAMAGFIEHLADRGHAVTVLAPAGVVGWQVNIYSSFAWRQRLREAKVRIMLLHAAQSFDGETVIATDASTGESVRIEGVSALVAPAHAVPNDRLARQIPARANLVVRQIGDCLAARSALEAVYEGHEAGRLI